MFGSGGAGLTPPWLRPTEQALRFIHSFIKTVIPSYCQTKSLEVAEVSHTNTWIKELKRGSAGAEPHQHLLTGLTAASAHALLNPAGFLAGPHGWNLRKGGGKQLPLRHPDTQCRACCGAGRVGAGHCCPAGRASSLPCASLERPLVHVTGINMPRSSAETKQGCGGIPRERPRDFLQS